MRCTRQEQTSTAKALTFNLEDLVWLHRRKELFPSQRRNKLMPRADGPFKVLGKLNDNA